MIRKYLLSFGILVLFFQCSLKDGEVNKPKKIEQVYAENIYNMGRSTKLNIYVDSTYEFTVAEEGFNHQKIEKFNGSCFIYKDTIFFKPFEFEFTNSEKATIKNNFIEFIGGEFPFKTKIKKSSIKFKQTIDFKQFNDYSIFTYDKKFYNYFTKEVEPYELNQSDLIELNKILGKCFIENKTELNKKSNQYRKQIIPVINKKNEVEVWVNCNCKDERFKNEHDYQIIEVNDGGNCHFSLKINLKRRIYSNLSINGEA